MFSLECKTEVPRITDSTTTGEPVTVHLTTSYGERIYVMTYDTPSSPYYSEDIHTLVLPRTLPKGVSDPGIS
jgi:hypothetical protein